MLFKGPTLYIYSDPKIAHLTSHWENFTSKMQKNYGIRQKTSGFKIHDFN